MVELEKLIGWLEGIKQEVEGLRKRKGELEKVLNMQGYSLKTIRGNTYLYVWETTGHARARWKCLGNVKHIGEAIEENKKEKVKALLEEYSSLKEREEKLREMLKEVLSVVEGKGVFKGVA